MKNHPSHRGALATVAVVTLLSSKIHRVPSRAFDASTWPSRPPMSFKFSLKVSHLSSSSHNAPPHRYITNICIFFSFFFLLSPLVLSMFNSSAHVLPGALLFSLSLCPVTLCVVLISLVIFFVFFSSSS